MNILQKSLRLNALFSGISGIIFMAFQVRIAQLFDISNTSVFLIVGCALLFFSLTIIYEMYKQRPLGVLWIIAQDILWVIGSTAILLFNTFEFAKNGNYLVAIIALIVLLMAVNQANALSKIDTSNQKGIKHLSFDHIVKAPKQTVWTIISDVTNYDKFAPNIDKVKIISGEGRGMVRSCSHGKDSWTETCSMWVEEKIYSFEVNTSSPDYPYPFKFLKGTWEVHEIDIHTTKIIIVFEFKYRHKLQNILIHPFLKGKFSKTANDLLDNWQKMLEQ